MTQFNDDKNTVKRYKDINSINELDEEMNIVNDISNLETKLKELSLTRNEYLYNKTIIKNQLDYLKSLDERLDELTLKYMKKEGEILTLIKAIIEIRKEIKYNILDKMSETNDIELCKELSFLMNLTKINILNLEELISGDENYIEGYMFNLDTYKYTYLNIDTDSNPHDRTEIFWEIMLALFY